jgi:hypothetical protein
LEIEMKYTQATVLLAVASMGWLAAPATARADRVLAAVERPTAIRAWDGVGAFSVYDSRAGVYRLAVTGPDGPPALVAVAPRAVPFDADVGPDSAMRPAIVYSRCARERPRRDCDIYRYSIARGVESKISRADSDAASEFNPSIWRGQVAWVRTIDARPAATPRIHVRSLSAPRAVRSRRLSLMAGKRCTSLAECGASVEELELYGRRLAVNVTYGRGNFGGICGLKEIQVQTIGQRARRLASVLCGLGGQSYAGLSFVGGNLYWARYCAGDPGGCPPSRAGAFRYRLRTGAYALTSFRRHLTGFTYLGRGQALEVRVTSNNAGYCGNPPTDAAGDCQIVRLDGLRFDAARPPR